MTDLWHLFLGFLTANLLGYGGGPSTIPLMQQEIVNHYHWETNAQFANVLALANALPGPISTKIATFVGYQVASWLGVLVALLATVLPSAIALVFLLKLLHKYRQSLAVKGMTLLVQPVIAILMVLLTWEIGQSAIHGIGILQSLVIGGVALLALTKWKIHPAFVIVGAFIYGGLVLPHLGA
jgi:chromate transporter